MINFNFGTNQFDLERQEMVEYQIRDRGIKDQWVLAAMSKVPRHEFVDSSWQDLAYSDRPLPIGYQQTISQPYIVAYMSETAEISPQAKVLEIGTGCGYQAAILGEIAKQVYSLEIIPELAQRASQTLSQLGYKNIEVKIGNLLHLFFTHNNVQKNYSSELFTTKASFKFLLQLGFLTHID